MQRVTGAVQHYAWGDPTYIPGLLGVEPDGRPWAELWLGTHPNGPTLLADGTPLAELTGELPYLLKVLAAAEPLSLQTHPTAEQARRGYAGGWFADPYAKPELLCALTRFEALCGIRPVVATLALLGRLGAGTIELATVLGERGPAAALEALYRGELDPQPVVDACCDGPGPEAGWVCRLAATYPGEPSVAATLLLNYVVLAPGEALRLDAGNLHAYLCGAGIELMGASDNVVRGGLTPKHVDVDLLLATVDTTPLDHPVLAGNGRYELPAAGIALVRCAAGAEHVATGHELAIDLAGGQWYLAPGDRLDATATTFVVTPIRAFDSTT
ncbi:MAG TPA: type I phosphomannose isomerase catalytic subunit [Ilumatobacter sp.]|nr:type I phosphomannose isomerase catalytic subunit [Ilumatobacter sp.]